jgi:tetratricopeptide (TPR) repeat protein
MTDINRPIYLTGKVVLDQGAQVPEPVPIQRVCGTTVRREGYTDMHGNFSIILGDSSATTFQDASESGAIAGRRSTITKAQLWGCEIRAMLPGYNSTSISLAGRDLNDTTSIGTLVLQKLGGTVGNSISVVSLKAPDKARKEYEKGVELYQKKKFEDAEKHLATAVEVYPQYASAWDLRGRTQMLRQQNEEATKSFEAAIAADDKYVPPYLRLAVLEAGKSDWQQVLRLTTRALELDPQSYPDAYFLNGAAQFNLHHYPEAERSALKANDMDKEHRYPRIQLLLGAISQNKGDRASATLYYTTYLQLEPNSAEAPTLKRFLANTGDENTRAAKQPPTSEPKP